MGSRVAPVVLNGVGFWWPDGTSVLDDVSCAFPMGSTGLVGDYGSLKTTLLRAIQGSLCPQRGAVAILDLAALAITTTNAQTPHSSANMEPVRIVVVETTESGLVDAHQDNVCRARA